MNKLSLNKSNKICKQLEQELNEYKYKIGNQSSIYIEYNKITDVQRERNRIYFEQEDFEILLKNYHLIESDIFNLKKAIDDKNNEVGINTILKNIDRFKKLLELYNQLEKYTQSQFIYPDEAFDTMVSDINKMKESEEIRDKVINVCILKNKLMVAETIKLYKQQLSILEDEKFEKNNSTKIEIDFSIVSKELLGLK
jgi:hypothetical protein